MRHELVLLRAALEDAMAATSTSPGAAASPGGQFLVATGRAQIHGSRETERWLVAELRAGLGDAWQGFNAVAAEWSAGVVIVVGLGAPDAGEQRFQQLFAELGEMGTTAASPPWLLLWLRSDGRAASCVRTQRGLESVEQVCIVGRSMVRIELGAPAHPDDEAALAEGTRFSRLAGALGSEALARIQRSVFAVVGCGRSGSAVAQTLVRSGASVVLIDDDDVEPHNLDGDLLAPVHEGLPKVDALARALRPLVRPGAWVDARCLSVQAAVVPRLLVGADILISTLDDDMARLWCALLACAGLLPHLDVGVAVPLEGPTGGDIRLTMPGQGCLLCCGGLASMAAPWSGPGIDPEGRRRHGDFSSHRRGSLRSLGQIAAHVGMRLVEQLFEGRYEGSRAVRLVEDPATGRIEIDDRAVRPAAACPLCRRFLGAGLQAVDAAAVTGVVVRATGIHRTLR